MGKKVNIIWSFICYAIAVCSVGYLLLSYLRENRALEYNDIIYIAFAISLVIPNKKIKFNILRIVFVLSFVNLISHNFFQGGSDLIFCLSYIITGVLFSQEYTCCECGKKYGWKILLRNQCPHCGNDVK